MNIGQENKNKVAVVVIGYNRLNAIKRLLDSLNNAIYPFEDVPLVISIDCSGDEKLYAYVRDFNWLHGEKFVNIQSERLGLKNHIFHCADLSSKFKAVILLEDDLFVSPYFYNYVIKAVETYKDDSRVAEIALYTDEMNGYVGLPFAPIQNGSDTILLQDVCTSGECFTERMWSGFRKWLAEPQNQDFSNIDMQPRIKAWTKAWSKSYNAYVVSNNLHVVYPRTAVTTNFNDPGTHGVNENDAITQTHLSLMNSEYRMFPFDEMPRYDIYFNNESLYDWLNISEKDICLDIYGSHDNIDKRYILSTRYLPYKIIRSYALSMKPIELNIKYNILGDGIYLYDSSVKVKCKKQGQYTDFLNEYFLQGFSVYQIWKEAYRTFTIKVLRKLKLMK